jgi:hypothetical protein
MANRTTTNEALRLLERPEIRNAVRREEIKTNKIQPGCLWRIAVVTSHHDDVRDLSFQPEQLLALGVQPKRNDRFLVHMLQAILGGIGAVDALIEELVTRLQERSYKTMLYTIKHGQLFLYKTRCAVQADGLIEVPDGIEIQQDERYISFKDFLEMECFPIRLVPTGSPSVFTMEVSGIVLRNAKGHLGRRIDKLAHVTQLNEDLWLIKEPYFVHRSLLDDEGRLIYLGLDEGIVRYSPDPELVVYNYEHIPYSVNCIPWKGYALVKYQNKTIRYARYADWHPLFRFTYFPLTCRTPLPLVDIPLPSKLWFDVFVQKGSSAVAYIPLHKVDHNIMLTKLNELWDSQLAKKNYSLLTFTKDIDHIEDYLKAKDKILHDYFDVVRLELG